MKNVKKEVIFSKPVPANFLWVLTFGFVKGIELLLSDDETKILGVRATKEAIEILKRDKIWWERYGKPLFQKIK